MLRSDIKTEAASIPEDYVIPGAADEADPRRNTRPCVTRACVRCKAAKKCCDNQRPCGRCVRMGQPDNCVDAQQQKPGRKPKRSADEMSEDSVPAVEPPSVRVLLNTPASLGAPAELFSGLNELYSLVGGPETMSTDFAQIFADISTPGVDAIASFETPPQTTLQSAQPPATPRDQFPSPQQWLSTFEPFAEKLKNIGNQLSAGLKPMPVSLYQLISHTMLIKAEQMGISAERVDRLRKELWNINPALEHLMRQQLEQRRRLPVKPQEPEAGGPSWLRPLDLPVGVIGIRMNMAEVTDLFVNTEAARLFGYTVEEMREGIIHDGDGFYVRHMHPDDWASNMPIVLSAISKQQRRIDSKSRLFDQTGACHDLSIQHTWEYGQDGVPSMHVMCFSKVSSL
eukprot:TRINITY_DN15137_c0_g1_i1.p1 TRINITY_DN15137_c0_g1~~TRINITY_DN15137_c0_g1_i1.p1  ORF type:complete len:398 (-),score=52.54 TRINITY_DN15137_c0_g1_i1:29-1222(-)